MGTHTDITPSSLDIYTNDTVSSTNNYREVIGQVSF